MADVTFKCLNCGSYLHFDPESQKWKCPYCNSLFQEDVLLQKEAAMREAAQKEEPEKSADGTQVVYHCSNCGSQIMTDETTVATECYYCHSPVVLQGKMQNDLRPDSVLPFTVDKEKAVEQFMNWTKGKRFVPKGFFKRNAVETMYGVYYPHFVSDCEMDGVLEGEGRMVNVINEPRYVTTVTKHYHVRRAGHLHFNDVMRPALTKANKKLSDGIHPFPIEEAKPFAGAYLTGFLAERRDIDAASIREDIEKELTGYVKPMLSESTHYDSTTFSADGKMTDIKTDYVMLPTWVLTYPNQKNPDDPYYYAMNGCTGKVCGRLPINKGKLWGMGVLCGLAVYVLGLLGSYFIW